MKIIIKKLEIKNFKGIDSAVFNFKAGKNVIYGDNAAGKTTICDAFMWLLVEKDSLGQSSFKLYNLGKDSSPEPEVTAFLDIDGEEVYLKKKAARNSKNGSSKLKYYFNNELPIKKKDYIDRLDKIGTQETIKTLISLNYFNTLKWEQQREILMGMVNIDTDTFFEDIILKNEKLSVLPDIIGKNTIAEHKAIVFNEKKAAEKLLAEASVIIADALNEISEYGGILAPSEIEKELFASKKRKEKAEKEKLRLEAGAEIVEKRKQLAAIQTDIINLENNFETRQKAFAKKKEISDIEGKILGLENTRNRLSAEINDLSETLEAKKKEISDLRETWKDEFNRVFTEAGDCPECGASPEHQKNVKTIESFNREKSERLEAINRKGKELSVKLQDIEELIKKLEKQHSEQTEKISRERGKISSLKIRLEEILIASIQTKKYREVTGKEKETALLNDRDKLREAEDLKQRIFALDDKIRDTDSKIADCYKELEKAERREKLKTKVKFLKEKEKDLSSRIEKMEQELFLIDLFNEVRVKMLEDKINSIFEITSWKMFEKQVNGVIKPVCIPMFNGVPWDTNLNRAHRKIVGVDIIKTLSKYYNLYLPLFVDDAEGITSLPEINTQVIRLVKPEITANNKEYYSKLQTKNFKEKGE